MIWRILQKSDVHGCGRGGHYFQMYLGGYSSEQARVIEGYLSREQHSNFAE
jgi:hypothetical protein